MMQRESSTESRSLKQQAIFGRITTEFNSANSVEQVLDTVVLSVQDLGYTYCSLWEKHGSRLFWKTPGLGIPEWMISSVKKVVTGLGMEDYQISVPLDSTSIYARCYAEQEPISTHNPEDLLCDLYLGDTPFQEIPKLVKSTGVKLVERLDAPEHTAFPIANYGVIFMASPGKIHAAEHKEWVRIILKQAETAIERQLVIEALRESEARYRALFEQANDAVFLVNLSDEIIDVNQRTCELLGYSREELLSMKIPDLQAPETRGLLGSTLKQELERFGHSPFEAVNLHKSGRRIPVEITASLIGDQEKGLVFTIVRDITKRKQVEDERREREQFLAVLNDITRAALGTPDLPTMAQILADRLGELIGADGCYITMWDEATQRTRPLAAYGTARDDYASIEIKPDEPTLTEVVVQTGRSLVIEDVNDTPYLSQRFVERFPDRSLLALPLTTGGEFKGAALIAFNQLHRFSPDEIARGEQIAEHIALAMTKVWLLEKERTVRERAEALYRVARTLIDLEDLATRLQTVVDSVADALPADRVTLIVLDLEAKETLHFVKGGPGARQVMAVPFEELQGGLTGWVMQERKPALSPKGVADSRETSLVRQRRSETNCGDIIVVPLAYRDEVWGTMTAIRRPDQLSFGERDVDLMMAMAYQAAIGIENSRLVEGLEAKVRARTADIHAEKEKSEAILQSVGDAITMSDLQMNIQYVNDAFTTLTGYSREEVIGRHARFLSSNDTPERVQGFMHTVRDKDQVWQSEMIARRKDGRTYDALITMAPMRDVEGNLVGFVSSHRNISQQKELDQARNRFLTSVSHELRTPLTSISLYAQLAQKAQNSPDKVEHYLRILNEQTERLKSLVKGILQMTELDAGQAVQSWRPIQLLSILQDAVTLHQDQAGAAGLTLTALPLPEQLPTVMGDQMRLTQALAELIENGVAFTPAGGRVTVDAKITQEDDQDWVTIGVSDTGPGITPEEQELIFDRLYRGRSTDAGNIRGLGLGLSMAQEIMRAHGGRITVKSELGKGSTFTIWLRCRDND